MSSEQSVLASTTVTTISQIRRCYTIEHDGYITRNSRVASRKLFERASSAVASLARRCDGSLCVPCVPPRIGVVRSYSLGELAVDARRVSLLLYSDFTVVSCA